MIHSIAKEGETTVLQIAGELDALSATGLRGTIDGIVTDAPPRVIVDLSALRLIDSSGIGALVSLYKKVRGYGGALAVRGLRDQPLAIFRLLKLDEILGTSSAVAS